MRPKISIVVPVYNVEKYLSKCVDSLLTQTLREIEIILVDDGSPDESPAICDIYAIQDSRIRVIHKKNGGLSSARNAGLELVSGEYYMFVDSDDWLNKETCEYSYKIANSHDADSLMFTYVKEFGDHAIVNHTFPDEFLLWGRKEIKEKFHRRLFGLVGDELAKPQESDLIVTACMQLFKTDKFKDIRFVDTKIIGTEDCWYQILLYEKCSSFVYIDKPFYHYLRVNEGSLTTKYNPYLFDRWQTLFDYMKKYIIDNDKGPEYQEALRNRIALSVLGAGINQAHSNDSIIEGGRNIKKIISTRRYSTALSSLNTCVMPLEWRFFFFLAKHKFSTTLFAMLKMIEYLRTHKK